MRQSLCLFALVLSLAACGKTPPAPEVQVKASLDKTAESDSVIVVNASTLKLAADTDAAKKWKFADLQHATNKANPGTPRRGAPFNADAFMNNFITDIRNWANPHPIYFVGTQTEFDVLAEHKGPDEVFNVLDTLSVQDAAGIQRQIVIVEWKFTSPMPRPNRPAQSTTQP